MKAVAAAREWWAAQRQRSGVWAPAHDAGDALSWHDFAARAGIDLRRDDRPCRGRICGHRLCDSRTEGERHEALEQALDEFHARSGDLHAPRLWPVATIERRAGLSDLRFEADPAGDGNREVQSLDYWGRIVGWFSRSADRGLVTVMYWLWESWLGSGATLAFCAVFVVRPARRLSPARSIAAPRRRAS